MIQESQSKNQNQHIHAKCCSPNLMFLQNFSLQQLKKQLLLNNDKSDKKITQILKKSQQQIIQYVGKNIFEDNDKKQIKQIDYQNATKIIYAKRIYTMDDAGTVQAMALNNQTIIAVGTKSSIREKYRKKGTQEYNFSNNIIIPGLIDTHCHYFYKGMNDKNFVNMKKISETKQTSQECYKRVWSLLQNKVKQANIYNKQIKLNKNDKKSKKKWVFAYYYDKLVTYQKDINQSLSSSKLHISYLDKISQNVTPILIMQANTHIAHVNNAAFHQAKVDPLNVDIKGGKFGKDQDSQGKEIPNGLVIQPPAIQMFSQFFPIPSPFQFYKDVQRLMNNALSRGCTSIHDGGIGIMGKTPLQHLALFYLMQSSLQVFKRIRVSGFITYQLWQQFAKKKHWYKPGLPIKPKLSGNNLGYNFRITAVKLWYDGSIQGGSAYLSKPYKFKGQQWNGNAPAFTKQQLHYRVNDVISRGWPIAVHCNGDQAFKQVTQKIIQIQKNIKNKNSQHKRIHRIQHCTLIDQKDLQNIQRNVQNQSKYEIQPSFLINYLSRYGKIYRDNLLAEGMAQKRMDIVKSAINYGLIPSLHSDYMMQQIDPLAFIHDTVNRIIDQNGQDYQLLNPKQKLNIFQALKSVTINAAKACYCDDIVGSLKPGKFADFVILQQDSDLLNEKKIKDIIVNETWTNGRKVYPMSPKQNQQGQMDQKMGLPTKRVKRQKKQ